MEVSSDALAEGVIDNRGITHLRNNCNAWFLILLTKQLPELVVQIELNYLYLT